MKKFKYKKEDILSSWSESQIALIHFAKSLTQNVEIIKDWILAVEEGNYRIPECSIEFRNERGIAKREFIEKTNTHALYFADKYGDRLTKVSADLDIFSKKYLSKWNGYLPEIDLSQMPKEWASSASTAQILYPYIKQYGDELKKILLIRLNLHLTHDETFVSFYYEELNMLLADNTITLDEIKNNPWKNYDNGSGYSLDKMFDALK
ncbi:MAG: hypothetical protein WC606_01400 [Candidatus Absconditabacterales bacterium]|jgi:hypothetical protein